MPKTCLKKTCKHQWVYAYTVIQVVDNIAKHYQCAKCGRWTFMYPKDMLIMWPDGSLDKYHDEDAEAIENATNLYDSDRIDSSRYANNRSWNSYSDSPTPVKDGPPPSNGSNRIPYIEADDFQL